MTALALISSELQALTLLEGFADGRVGSCSVRLVGPWQPDHELEAALGAGGNSRRLSCSDMAGALRPDLLILGDVYSRLGGALIMAVRPARVVLLEDGSATIRAQEQLSNGRPLQRVSRRGRLTLLEHAETSVLSALARRNRIEWWISGRHGSTRQGTGTTWRHGFARLRGSPPQEVHESVRRLIVGSALVNDGHLRPGAYERWLKSIPVDDHTYFISHRRELPRHATLVRDLGMSILESDVGIERAVHRMPRLRSVHSLPTSPVLTVPTVRPDVTVHCTPLEANDWDPSTPTTIEEVCTLVLSAHRQTHQPG